MQDHDTQLTQAAVKTAEQLPPDLMLLKMENESMMSAARIVPRDPMKIVGQLKQLIDAYPAAADEAIYSKPVGTVMQVTCGKCKVEYEVVKIEQDTACPACESPERGAVRKVKKFAEGLSVRAAESIRSIYGYTRLATTTEMLPDGKAKITGILVDYAAGNITSDERVVSPFYKAKGGQMVKTPEDRFLNVTVKAEKAKLRRDVVLDSVPNIVKAMFRDECEKKLKALVSPELVEQRIIPAFAEYGITEEQLDKIVGRPKKLGWREEDRLVLKKILIALKNEETTVRELLADLGENGEAQQQPQGPVNASDLTNPKGSKEPVNADAGAGGELPTLASAQAELAECKTLKECQEVYDRNAPHLSEEDQIQFAHDRDEQKQAIRDARGAGSNKQQELEV